jgi:parallel beta-helix repeat protein
VSITKDSLVILAQSDNVCVRSDFGGDACFDVTADNVTISGFDLSGPSPGISFEGSDNKFTNNTIHDLGTLGVNALVCRDADGGSDNNTIEHNTISNSDLGIVVVCNATDAVNTGNIIRNNTVSQCATVGIVIRNGKDFSISENFINGIVDGIGISIIAEESNIPQGNHQIVNNEVSACSGPGIALFANPGTTLTQNLIDSNETHGNPVAGLYLWAGADATLSSNQIESNTVYNNENGIHAEGGVDNNNISHNLVYLNYMYGIIVEGDHNKVFLNRVLDNPMVGIVVGGQHNRVHANSALDNVGHGISVNGDNNIMVFNRALGNGFDLEDIGTGNIWRKNTYETANWE